MADHVTLSVIQFSKAGFMISDWRLIPALTQAYSGLAGCNVKLGEPQVPRPGANRLTPAPGRGLPKQHSGDTLAGGMMNVIEEVFGLLIAVAALALVSRKIPVPFPILLVLG